jgi:C4-dicarboxylate transporter DctQ subunit
MKDFVITLEKKLAYFDKLFTFIIMGGMLYLISLSFLNVFFRYILGSSTLYWADEVLRYSLIWLIFLGSVLGISRKLHIKIDVLQQFLPGKACYWLSLCGYISMFVFFVVMSRQGFLFAETGSNMVSASLALKMNHVYMVIPVSFILMAFNTIRLILREYVIKSDEGCTGWETFI